MKRTALLLCLAIGALPALAAEEGGHGGGGHGEAAKAGAPGTNVEMPFLMAPVTDEAGKLTGYAYISTRLTATSAGAVLAVRDKIPFIQDAFVRDVNAGQVTGEKTPDAVDIPALEARLLADARKVMGKDQVKTITVCTVQMSPLKSNSPQARTSAEAADSHGQAAAPEKPRCG